MIVLTVSKFSNTKIRGKGQEGGLGEVDRCSIETGRAGIGGCNNDRLSLP